MKSERLEAPLEGVRNTKAGIERRLPGRIGDLLVERRHGDTASIGPEQVEKSVQHHTIGG
jgi:hypothetical protein